MEPRSWKSRLDELSDRPRIALVMWIFVVVAISALHLCINANDIGHPELWLDESSTWGVAHRPFVTVLTLPTQFHSQPPLYYLLLHFWMKIYDARWFMRGLGWLSCLCLLELVLFWLHELSLSARVVFCITFITASLTHYLSTALRPYGMAALTTFVSTVLLLRLLRDPTRRRAIHYTLIALVMLYTMAFDVWVVVAHGLTVGSFLVFHSAREGIRVIVKRYRAVFVAIGAVAIGYLPYVWIAAHWHYTQNGRDNGEQVLTTGHYTYTLNEHFKDSGAAMLLIYGLIAIALWAELRKKNALSLVWPLIAAGQVGFVVYFMTGRGMGPAGRYMTPMLPCVCFLVALGWQHLQPRPPRVAWQVLLGFLCYLLWPEVIAYSAYLASPRPLGTFGKLRQRLKMQAGKKLVFFDIGYSGQDFEYVIRHDADISSAVMRGEGGNAGGDNHLDPEYIRRTIATTTSDTRCYYYQLESPQGVYATVFAPEMSRLGYEEVAPIGKVHGFCRD